MPEVLVAITFRTRPLSPSSRSSPPLDTYFIPFSFFFRPPPPLRARDIILVGVYLAHGDLRQWCLFVQKQPFQPPSDSDHPGGSAPQK